MIPEATYIEFLLQYNLYKKSNTSLQYTKNKFKNNVKY